MTFHVAPLPLADPSSIRWMEEGSAPGLLLLCHAGAICHDLSAQRRDSAQATHGTRTSSTEGVRITPNALMMCCTSTVSIRAAPTLAY
jgi:hypothetical protein